MNAELLVSDEVMQQVVKHLEAALGSASMCPDVSVFGNAPVVGAAGETDRMLIAGSLGLDEVLTGARDGVNTTQRQLGEVDRRMGTGFQRAQ